MGARLVLGGDVMIGRSFNKIFLKYPNFNIWGNAKDSICWANIFGINLETTITDAKIKWPHKTFNFQLSPKYKNILSQGCVAYASLANNHILDYKLKGMNDTIQTLNSLNIIHTGCGKNVQEAMNPVFKIIQNIKFGFLSAADHYDYWAATANKPGIWYIDIEKIKTHTGGFEYIKSIKEQCDILIFSMHFGPNYIDTPSDAMKVFARNCVESGVDIFHGHSAHHVLPYEKWPQLNNSNKQKYGHIFYSFGDLVDDYAIDEKYRSDLGILVLFDIDSDLTFTPQIFPTRIRNCQVNMITKLDPDYHLVFNKLKLPIQHK